MSSLLRIRIDSDWPVPNTCCEWALYDIRGERIERGESDPQLWPVAESCELMLSADQCLLLEAQLPKGVKGDDSKLLGYVVEDHLIGDVQNEHVVAGAPRADGTAPIWVVSRMRLNAVLGALRQLGREPQRAYSELMLAPIAPDCWTVCLRDAKGFARLGPESGFAFDVAGSEPPPELLLAMQGARTAGNAPIRVDLYAGGDAQAVCDAWQAALGVPVRGEDAFHWDEQGARSARNLLVGEFTPERGRHSNWLPFKPALAVGVALLALYSVFSLGQWMWMSQRAGSLRAKATEIFRASFPGVQAVVDPALQMQRLYDQAMRERGRLGGSDFLPLLAAVSGALAGQGRYRSLAYEDGRLEFSVTLPNARAVGRLRDALSRRGLSTTLRGSRRAAGGLETSFSVRLGT